MRTLGGKGVELRATVQDTQELRWWLLGFGANVRVLGPDALVRELGDVAGRMAAAYREDVGGNS